MRKRRAPIAGGRRPVGHVDQHLVQLRGRQFLVERPVELDRGVEHPVDFVAAQGGDEHERGARGEEQGFEQGVLVFFAVIPHALVAADPLRLLEGLVHEVPLIHDDDDRPALLDRLARDGLVLHGHPLHGIEDEEDDVGPLDRLQRTQARKIFDRGGELGRGLDSGGVDQPEGILLAVPPLEVERQFDGIARRAGRLVDDEPVALEEAVGERGLADVGAADEAKTEGIGGGLGRAGPFLGARADPRQDRRAQVRLAPAVLGGHADRLAQAEPVGLGQVDLLIVEIGLVHDQKHVLLLPAQAGRDAPVQRRDAVQAVDDEEDQGGCVDGKADLFLRGRDQLRGGLSALEPEAAGVEQRVAAVLDLRGDHIPGDPGLIVHDGDPPAREPVEKPALAGVRPADQGDDAGMGHQPVALRLPAFAT